MQILVVKISKCGSFGDALYTSFMAFTFGNIHVASKKHVLNLKALNNVVLLDKSDGYASYQYTVIVLADEPYNGSQLRSISTFLEKNRITRYKILSALNCMISKDEIKDDQKSGIIDFYRYNSTDFASEIPEGSPIITVGAALYALTRSDDIYPDDVHQRIFGKAQFWFSPTQTVQGNWIFPIDSFRDIFAYGFAANPVDSFKTKLAEFQFKAVLSKLQYFPPRYPSLRKVFIQSAEEFNSLVYMGNKHRKNEVLVYDLETSGFDHTADQIGCITLSFDGIVGYYVPWRFVDKEHLAELLANNIQTGANLKFDIKFLWREGISTARVDEDVVAMGHVLDETRSNSLKALAYFYSEYGGYEYPLDEYKRKTKIDNYLEIPEDLLREYAIMDAIVCWRVYNSLSNHMDALDKKYPSEVGNNHTMREYYKMVRIPAINMYAKFEYRGIYIDKAQMDATQQMLEQRLSEVQKELAAAFAVPVTYDFKSTTSLGRLLRDKGWECLGSNKKGEYKVADDQLERWGKTHPEALLLQQMRSLNVFLNTFIGDEEDSKGWRQYLRYHPEDDSWRIHANYNAMGTESGRTRCSAPNLMNIPTHGEFAKEIKKSIMPPNKEDYYLMTVDYAALQLRLATVDGDDPVLRKVFSSARADVHSATAYNQFFKGKAVDVEEVIVEQDGKTYQFLGGEVVMTARGEVFARDLLESDVLTGG